MQPNGSPIEYPTVLINGVKCVVKFSNRTLYRLAKNGVDIQLFGERLRTGRVSIDLIYDFLHASIVWPPQVPQMSAEDLADAVPTADATRAVLDAMGKVQPPAEMKLREPAATPLQ